MMCSDKIEWKAGKNLTVKQTKKKVKAKGKKPARFVTVEEPSESFFSFFSPIQIPTGDEEGEIEEEDVRASFLFLLLFIIHDADPCIIVG